MNLIYNRLIVWEKKTSFATLGTFSRVTFSRETIVCDKIIAKLGKKWQLLYWSNMKFSNRVERAFLFFVFVLFCFCLAYMYLICIISMERCHRVKDTININTSILYPCRLYLLYILVSVHVFRSSWKKKRSQIHASFPNFKWVRKFRVYRGLF